MLKTLYTVESWASPAIHCSERLVGLGLGHHNREGQIASRLRGQRSSST